MADKRRSVSIDVPDVGRVTLRAGKRPLGRNPGIASGEGYATLGTAKERVASRIGTHPWQSSVSVGTVHDTRVAIHDNKYHTSIPVGTRGKPLLALEWLSAAVDAGGREARSFGVFFDGGLVFRLIMTERARDSFVFVPKDLGLDPADVDALIAKFL